MDVKFVRPHLSAAERFPDTENRIAGPYPAAESIAIGREAVVITVQEVGNQLEHAGLLRTIAINRPFLARAHLVDEFLLGNTWTLSTDECPRDRQISLVRHIIVRITEHGPCETALHQAVRKEFFPYRLVVQLRDDALHVEKRKRGMILNRQNCRSLDGDTALPPARHFTGGAASFAGATVLHPLFQKSIQDIYRCGSRHIRERWASACRS